MNITFNLSNFSLEPGDGPITEVIRKTDIELISNYCDKLDQNIVIFILIYWIGGLLLQGAYRFNLINTDQYVRYTQSFMVSFIAFGMITLAYMFFRI